MLREEAGSLLHGESSDSQLSSQSCIPFGSEENVTANAFINGMEDMVSVPILCWEFLLPMIRLQTNVEVACEHSVSLLTL